MSVSRLPSKYRIFASIFVCVAVLFAVASMVRRDDATAAQPKSGAMPPAAVTVQTITSKQVRIWSDFSGKLTAVNAADIRPEVNGRITEIRFRDGQEVKAGRVLFVIDPRPYAAALAKEESSLASARSNAVFAKQEVERARKLIRTHVIPRQALEQRTAANQVAEAAIASAEAEVKHARLDVEHAYIKAPISGRVGRAEITVGNVVQAGANAPLLTSIVAHAAVYADFDVDEKTYVQAVRGSSEQAKGEQSIPVRLTLRGDGTKTYDGHIHAFDNKISGTSGTIRARALFDNPDGSLIPGMFASIKMGLNAAAGTILVPERAVGTDQNKRYVYAVGEGNKVIYREVTLGASMEGQRIVLSGLKAGEVIIVNGVQHVQPGAVVDPKQADEPTL
jgi:membrane fusion protein, multidrug efflux system